MNDLCENLNHYLLYYATKTKRFVMYMKTGHIIGKEISQKTREN